MDASAIRATKLNNLYCIYLRTYSKAKIGALEAFDFATNDQHELQVMASAVRAAHADEDFESFEALTAEFE